MRQDCTTTFLFVQWYSTRSEWCHLFRLFLSEYFIIGEVRYTKSFENHFSKWRPEVWRSTRTIYVKLSPSIFWMVTTLSVKLRKKVLISINSVHSIISKYKSTKHIGNLMDLGRKRTDRRKLALLVKVELKNQLKIDVSESTIGRRAHEIGLYGRTSRKKSCVNKLNRTKRIEYAWYYREKPLEFWNNILWSKESKFNCFGSDREIMVLRSVKEEFESHVRAVFRKQMLAV